jgi:hypothetical protein
MISNNDKQIKKILYIIFKKWHFMKQWNLSKHRVEVNVECMFIYSFTQENINSLPNTPTPFNETIIDA